MASQVTEKVKVFPPGTTILRAIGTSTSTCFTEQQVDTAMQRKGRRRRRKIKRRLTRHKSPVHQSICQQEFSAHLRFFIKTGLITLWCNYCGCGFHLHLDTCRECLVVELWSLAGRVAASLMDSNELKLSGPAAAACLLISASSRRHLV